MPVSASALVNEARSQIREIDADRLRSSVNASRVVIDVREPHEFASGHLPGAINIPRGVIEFEVEAHPAMSGVTDPALAVRDREIVVYCRSGGRSALAAWSLQRMGFRQVTSLAGGVSAWSERGFELLAR